MSIRILFPIAAVVLGGCAPTTLYQKSKDQAAAYVDRYREERTVVSEVNETDKPYVKAVAVEHRPATRGGVTLKLSGAPLQAAIGPIAQGEGYDVSYAARIDANRFVTIGITNQAFESAIKDIAFAAGYIAVFDHRNRRVTVTDEATYTFRIDPHSIEKRKDDYSTTSNPGSGGAGGQGSGSSSGGSQSGVATSTSVTIGANSGESGPEDLLGVIRAMVGAGPKSAAVQYVPTTGMLVVRGNAAELRRVSDLVDVHQRDALTQVELDAAIVEVTLGDDFQYGIDWSRVVPLAGSLSGGQAAISVTSRGIVSNPAVTANITTSSVTSVIKALKEKTNANVVAEPRVTSLNHREGMYLRATQKPYLPEVTQSAVQNAGTTTSGKLAYVPDGISFAFKPAIMGPNLIRARILPVITSVGNQVNFQLGQSQLTGYNVVVSQSHLEVELEAGKTTIVGGLSMDRSNNLDSGVPVVADVPLIGSLLTSKTRNGQKTQTVMLLRARIIPAPSGHQTLIGESL